MVTNFLHGRRDNVWFSVFEILTQLMLYFLGLCYFLCIPRPSKQGFFAQICEVRGVAIIQEKTSPNLATCQREQKFKIPALVSQPVRTFSLNMANSNFFPQNMATWGHFFQPKNKNLCMSHTTIVFAATSPKFATI